MSRDKYLFPLQHNRTQPFGGRHADSLLSESPCNEENDIPGHSRNCSLRTISPLLENNLLNRQPLSTDSADTLIAIQFAKRYELLRRDNESLRLTVIEQEQQIEQLKAIVKSLQSDGYSSDSRHEKSTLTQSSLPVVRVSPQKRSTSSSATQTPRSARRASAARRLQIENSSESEATPTAGRSPVRLNAVHSLLSPPAPTRMPASGEVETPILQRSKRRPPAVLTRSLSTSDSFMLTTPRTPRDEAAQPGPFMLMRGSGSQDSLRPADAKDSPAYYLKLRRPDFIRNLEERQSLIRTVAARRSAVEVNRKNSLKAVVEGKLPVEAVEDIIFVDPTKIKAFPQREMAALTKRHLSSTKEVRDSVRSRETKVEKTANRILAKCYDMRTQGKLHGSPLNLNSLRL